MNNTNDYDLIRCMEELALSGDAYAAIDRLYQLCRFRRHELSRDGFRAELMSLVQSGKLRLEGRRVYLSHIWACEEQASKCLYVLLADNDLDPLCLPVTSEDVILCAEQRRAVETAISHRLSMILGGAGTGKTSIIRAVYDLSDAADILLCAPTGKAARNLTQRTGLPAGTVHKLLGIHSGMSFLDAAQLNAGLVIVDEASMLSLDMLAGLLSAIPENGSLVLLGDPNQLLAVGAGNILLELLTLGVPCVRLRENHRQSETKTALYQNVVNFDHIRSLDDLMCDEHFSILSSPNASTALDAVADEAARRILAGESCQVLASTNEDVTRLNELIQARVNSAFGKPYIRWQDKRFMDGDRVMICRNDPCRGICNGDVGSFRIHASNSISVSMPGNRTAHWSSEELSKCLSSLRPAYAVTAHKAQGNEYDTVLLYARGTLNRNLFYTSISRARKNVIIYGRGSEIDRALRTAPRERCTMLAQKTRMLSIRAAG